MHILSLDQTLPNHLLYEVVIGNVFDRESALKWVKSTYLFQCAKADYSRYGGSPTCGVDDLMPIMINTALRELVNWGLIELDRNGKIDVGIKMAFWKESKLTYETFKHLVEYNTQMALRIPENILPEYLVRIANLNLTLSCELEFVFIGYFLYTCL